MKKEKEIWLNPDEVQQLLEGGLYWKDIEAKLSPENADALRRHISVDELDIESIIGEASRKKSVDKQAILKAEQEEVEEVGEVRAILLGEERPSRMEEDRESDPGVNRQLNINQIPNNGRETFVPLAATKEEVDSQDYSETQTNEHLSRQQNDESEVNFEERNRFMRLHESENTFAAGSSSNTLSGIKGFSDKALKEPMEEDEEHMEKEPSPGGFKLVILLVIVAALTFGFWYYFLSS